MQLDKINKVVGDKCTRIPVFVFFFARGLGKAALCLRGVCPEPFSSAGWSSLVARQAHNLKVVGSNPTPATKEINDLAVLRGGFFAFVRTFVRTSFCDLQV